uniref:Uncharacterized protein n=1 Tax=Siphoviridae sp. ctNmW2 TaxID=2826306 RepID=A0A8S5MIA1_9CAUD|nr:MAG TPA: hypothetical protein [Siphoviridae sp. ctNmW2]DAO73933.1 MAG TPA: hypothetical protein [Caudoviricetes sp.]DAU33014.1 MAG TPA: hypothetical protein [Caudoviricetes sp.]
MRFNYSRNVTTQRGYLNPHKLNIKRGILHESNANPITKINSW